ncbi:hypothetical protein HDU98_006605 [Podochytrium sp. JEL0797]|nr:hypothetical protein HDU98_006605 [Podochytrium sp. JEL0797]
MNAITTFLAGDNATLFGSSASSSKTLAFYNEQMAAHGCSETVKLEFLGEPRGKALFARTDIAKGDRIFAELPLFSIQAADNAPLARVCARCLHFVGTPLEQVRHMLPDRKLSSSEESLLVKFGNVPGFSGASTTECACGEVYCSPECRDKDANSGHAQICPAKNPSAAAHIAAFKAHAKDTNETFLLALKVFGFIAGRVLAHPQPESKDALEEAVWPVRVFAKDFWWNVCLPDEGDDPEELTRALYTLLEESIVHLKGVFQHIPEMKPCLNRSFYSLLMGIFERNNVSIVNPSPLLPLLDKMPSELTEAIMTRAADFIPNHGHGHDDHDHGHGHDHEGHSHDHQHDDAGSSKADPFEALDALVAEGTGLHSLHATINHSCTPNAILFKDMVGTDVASDLQDQEVIRDGRTVVRAIRNIKAGDEITISYLDEGGADGFESDAEEEEDDEEEKAWRAMSLLEYGIEVCHCPKCQAK